MSWLLGALLMGGSVYINGVKANSLRNFEIEDVDITIDADGNVYITASNLIVEVAGANAGPAPSPAETALESVAPAPLETRPDPPILGDEPLAVGGQAASAPAVVGSLSATDMPPTVLAVPPVGAVPAERWWLVIEDNASNGHLLEISVNGTAVSNYQSGSAPVMIDLAAFLHLGENQVDVVAQASGTLGGGVLHVYVAPGANHGGELVLEEPVLVFSRRASDDPAGANFHRTLSIP